MAPAFDIILDPLLYLALLPHPDNDIPPLIHMTVSDKRQLAPHQILSVLSWGRFNKGYTLLLYDDDDMATYIETYFPNFLPSKRHPRLGVPSLVVFVAVVSHSSRFACPILCHQATVGIAVFTHS